MHDRGFPVAAERPRPPVIGFVPTLIRNGPGILEGNRPQAQWLVTCLCRCEEGQVQEIANLATAPGNSPGPGWEFASIIDIHPAE